MNKIKLNITIDKDWLEATWTKEVTTINEVEKEVEVDGELTKEIVREESVTTEQLHCESFSGHPEHIAMLEAKALEFGTSLDEFEGLIAQAKEAFVMPTAEELLAYELDQKLQIANQYLASTGWYVERLNDPSSGKAIPEEVLAKRVEARELINILEAELEGANNGYNN